MALLEVKGIKKTYTTRFGNNHVHALKEVNFDVESGDFVSIMGESGSGKTTLLNLLAAFDKATAGTIKIDGKELASLKDNALAAYRRNNLGFVFQDFNLLDTLNIKDNILLPIVLSGKNINDYKERLKNITKDIGIDEILKKYPYEISGGQKQRVAVARALITDPKLILADEPTGALDSQSSDELLRVFRRINGNGQTILMVTHSVAAASHSNRVLFIKDGVVYHQIYRGESTDEELYQKISDTLTMLRKGGENG
ncbi:MAG: ABC transporter ATP-binding protein [Clostridiales bacterium]|nr:ABC transporter ATP-binding protein [Clostridiales bacterium]